MPTEMGRQRPGPGGSGGWCITPGQDVLDRLGLLLYRRELLGKALDGVAEQPRLGDGGIEKACSGSGAAVVTTPEGGSPTEPSSSEDVSPCCDQHPIYGWRTELNAGRPVGRTSEIIREPDGMFAA